MLPSWAVSSVSSGVARSRADFLQRREGEDEARMAIPTQHPTGVANFDRTEDGSDAAGRVVLDRSEHAAIGQIRRKSVYVSASWPRSRSEGQP